MDSPASVPDSSYYIAMAEGRWEQVAAPWGYRVGLPWMASHLSRICHLSTATAFLVLAVVCAGILIAAAACLLRGRARLLPVLLLTPVAINLVHDYYLPDLMHAALVAVFFLLFSVEWWIAAALLLLPMMLVRESTILLTAIAILVVRNRRWSVVAVAATFAGLMVSHLAVPHLSNVHGIGGILYTVLKVPVNALRNLTGIIVVPNTLRGQNGYTCAAAFTFRLHLGNLREVGVCPPDVTVPLSTLAIMLTTFGTGPLMFFSRADRPSQIWMRVAMLYGLAAFAMAPLLGAAIERLASYGWPLFWLYVPRRGESPASWIIYLIVSWLPMVFQLDKHSERAVYVVLCAVLLYWIAAVSARQRDLVNARS